MSPTANGIFSVHQFRHNFHNNWYRMASIQPRQDDIRSFDHGKYRILQWHMQCNKFKRSFKLTNIRQHKSRVWTVIFCYVKERFDHKFHQDTAHLQFSQNLQNYQYYIKKLKKLLNFQNILNLNVSYIHVHQNLKLTCQFIKEKLNWLTEREFDNHTSTHQQKLVTAILSTSDHSCAELFTDMEPSEEYWRTWREAVPSILPWHRYTVNQNK